MNILSETRSLDLYPEARPRASHTFSYGSSLEIFWVPISESSVLNDYWVCEQSGIRFLDPDLNVSHRKKIRLLVNKW